MLKIHIFEPRWNTLRCTLQILFDLVTICFTPVTVLGILMLALPLLGCPNEFGAYAAETYAQAPLAYLAYLSLAVLMAGGITYIAMRISNSLLTPEERAAGERDIY